MRSSFRLTSRRLRAPAVVALLCTWLAGGAAAQPTVLSGTQDAEQFGNGLAVVGDVDGDGVDDFAVGSPRGNVGDRAAAGFVQVFSGATRAVIARFEGEVAEDCFGRSVTGLGDVTGDGRPEIAIGAPRTDFVIPGPNDPFAPSRPRNVPNGGSVYVYSIANGRLVWRFDASNRNDALGFDTANGGDVDGDGTADLLVGAPFGGGLKTGPGQVFVLSGVNGRVIQRLDGEANEDQFGTAVDGGVDLNGDGRPEILVGAWEADWTRRPDAGSAFLFSGADGAPLHRFIGRAREDRLGRAVAFIDDISGDGVSDILIGAPDVTTGFASGGGSVALYSGADFDLVYQRDDPWVKTDDRLGTAIAASPDLDGDGVPDFIASAPGVNEGSGSIFVFSGRRGAVIGRMNGAAAHHNLGRHLTPIRSLSAPGSLDFLVAAPGPETRSRQIGRVYICATAADSDADGAWDCLDNCPGLANPTQWDTDLDGLGDECDPCTDSDADGFADSAGASTCGVDNCPHLPNPDQNPSDLDGDGIPDSCDNCTPLVNPEQLEDQTCQALQGGVRIRQRKRAGTNRFVAQLSGEVFDLKVLDQVTAFPSTLEIQDAKALSLFLRDIPPGMLKRVGQRRVLYRVSPKLSTGIDRFTMDINPRGKLQITVRGHGVLAPTGIPRARFKFANYRFAAIEKRAVKRHAKARRHG